MTKGKTFAEQSIIQAENSLKTALAVLGLPVRGSYPPGEVCMILGISDRTFWYLIEGFERDENGRIRTPDKLDSFILRTNRRVTYLELVDFIRRNNSYSRKSGSDAPPAAGKERE